MGALKRRRQKRRENQGASSGTPPGRSYQDMGDEGDDAHPVDEAVERRLDHRVLRREIHAATDRLVEALGDEHHLWLGLEELLGDYRIDRETAYFDLGYEHGRATGRAEGLAEGRTRTAPAYRALAQHVREAAANAGLPQTDATAALIEAAWALSFNAAGAAMGQQPRRAAPR